MKIEDRKKIKLKVKKRVGEEFWDDFNIEKEVDFILDEAEKIK